MRTKHLRSSIGTGILMSVHDAHEATHASPLRELDKRELLVQGPSLSKHKMTRYARNLGGMAPFPPGYAYGGILKHCFGFNLPYFH